MGGYQQYANNQGAGGEYSAQTGFDMGPLWEGLKTGAKATGQFMHGIWDRAWPQLTTVQGPQAGFGKPLSDEEQAQMEKDLRDKGMWGVFKDINQEAFNEPWRDKLRRLGLQAKEKVADPNGPIAQTLRVPENPREAGRQLVDMYQWRQMFRGPEFELEHPWSGDPMAAESEIVAPLGPKRIVPEGPKSPEDELFDALKTDPYNKPVEELTPQRRRTDAGYKPPVKPSATSVPVPDRRVPQSSAEAGGSGTAAGAASDTELFQQARKELGEKANLSDVLKRAQELKAKLGTKSGFVNETPNKPISINRGWITKDGKYIDIGGGEHGEAALEHGLAEDTPGNREELMEAAGEAIDKGHIRVNTYDGDEFDFDARHMDANTLERLKDGVVHIPEGKNIRISLGEHDRSFDSSSEAYTWLNGLQATGVAPKGGEMTRLSAFGQAFKELGDDASPADLKKRTDEIMESNKPSPKGGPKAGIVPEDHVTSMLQGLKDKADKLWGPTEPEPQKPAAPNYEDLLSRSIDNAKSKDPFDKIHWDSYENDEGNAGFELRSHAKSGKMIGWLTYDDLPQENGFKVNESFVPDEFKGQGEGSRLYNAMINHAKKAGKDFVRSDDSVSEDAAKVWERLGAKKQEDGTYLLKLGDKK